MPLMTVPSMTRRQFLATTATAAAAITRLQAAGKTTRWALLADTHLAANPDEQYRGFFPRQNVSKVFAAVERAAPEGALIAGDIARLEGKAEDYQALRGLLDPLAAKIPVAMGLGNHDHRANFLGVFGEGQGGRQPVSGRHVLVVERPPVRFLVLDSLFLPNVTPGVLGKAQRTWLADFLKTADSTPTVVVVHHTLDDADGSLLDAERMFRILTPHRQVKAVVYGHSHVWKFDTLDGMHLINIPAVGYNFRDSEPVGWVEAALAAEGADLKLHAIGGNTQQDGKTTSLQWRG